MIKLQPAIDRIKSLLDQDTEASVTYAALEARLAIERVVYDRLRQRHEYISHEQLKKWQPGGVINSLISEVDPYLTQTMILSISKGPVDSSTKPEDQEYVQIGTEIGFDSKKIVKLWNALARLALHIRLPESKDDKIPEYGNKREIALKVEEVLSELARLEMSTMTLSGIPDGGNVSFVCTCGVNNKRRAKLLKHGQYVYCINPKCNETWKAQFNGTEINFENVLVDVPCKTCGTVNYIPWRMVTKMKYDEILKYPCYKCNGYNFVKWQLMQAVLPPPEKN
jgi:hypothetical protein